MKVREGNQLESALVKLSFSMLMAVLRAFGVTTHRFIIFKTYGDVSKLVKLPDVSQVKRWSILSRW